MGWMPVSPNSYVGNRILNVTAFRVWPFEAMLIADRKVEAVLCEVNALMKKTQQVPLPFAHVKRVVCAPRS